MEKKKPTGINVTPWNYNAVSKLALINHILNKGVISFSTESKLQNSEKGILSSIDSANASVYNMGLWSLMKAVLPSDTLKEKFKNYLTTFHYAVITQLSNGVTAMPSAAYSKLTNDCSNDEDVTKVLDLFKEKMKEYLDRRSFSLPYTGRSIKIDLGEYAVARYLRSQFIQPVTMKDITNYKINLDSYRSTSSKKETASAMWSKLNTPQPYEIDREAIKKDLKETILERRNIVKTTKQLDKLIDRTIEKRGIASVEKLSTVKDNCLFPILKLNPMTGVGHIFQSDEDVLDARRTPGVLPAHLIDMYSSIVTNYTIGGNIQTVLLGKDPEEVDQQLINIYLFFTEVATLARLVGSTPKDLLDTVYTTNPILLLQKVAVVKFTGDEYLYTSGSMEIYCTESVLSQLLSDKVEFNREENKLLIGNIDYWTTELGGYYVPKDGNYQNLLPNNRQSK